MNKRKLKFSEKMLVIILIYAITLFERAIAFAFLNRAENIFAYLMPILGTLITSTFIAFEWKEKNENINKQNLNPEFLKIDNPTISPQTSLSEEEIEGFKEYFDDTSGY